MQLLVTIVLLRVRPHNGSMCATERSTMKNKCRVLARRAIAGVLSLSMVVGGVSAVALAEGEPIGIEVQSDAIASAPQLVVGNAYNSPEGFTGALYAYRVTITPNSAASPQVVYVSGGLNDAGAENNFELSAQQLLDLFYAGTRPVPAVTGGKVTVGSQDEEGLYGKAESNTADWNISLYLNKMFVNDKDSLMLSIPTQDLNEQSGVTRVFTISIQIIMNLAHGEMLYSPNDSQAFSPISKYSPIYDKQQKEPAISLMLPDYRLADPAYYGVTFQNNINASTKGNPAKVTATVTDPEFTKYYGSITKEFIIQPKELTASWVDPDQVERPWSYTYDGNRHGPVLQLDGVIAGDTVNAQVRYSRVQSGDIVYDEAVVERPINADACAAYVVTTEEPVEGQANLYNKVMALDNSNYRVYTETWTHNTQSDAWESSVKFKPQGFRIARREIQGFKWTEGPFPYKKEAYTVLPELVGLAEVDEGKIKLNPDYFTYVNNTGTEVGKYQAQVQGNKALQDAWENFYTHGGAYPELFVDENGNAAKNYMRPSDPMADSSFVYDWEITPADLSKASVTFDPASFTYNGKAKNPTIKVTLDGRELVEGEDYAKPTIANNVNAGKVAVTIAPADGNNNYINTATSEYTINPRSLSKATVTLSKTSYLYNGKARKPKATVTLGSKTLKNGTDYTVAYTNNIYAGKATATIKGKGNYKGSVRASFTIKPVDVTKATVSLSKKSYYYNGKARKPKVTVTLGNTTLVQGTDYTIAYADNVRVGKATVTVTGINGYKGSLTANFTIKANSVSYTAYSQTYGWNAPAGKDGTAAGVTGEFKRLEAFTAQVAGGISINYRSHVQGIGWESKWAKDGEVSGTTGSSKRIEAIQMKLSGAAAKGNSVWYRVYSQTYGWLGWTKDGKSAGTAGLSKRVEAYEVLILAKGSTPDGYDAAKPAFIQRT